MNVRAISLIGFVALLSSENHGVGAFATRPNCFHGCRRCKDTPMLLRLEARMSRRRAFLSIGAGYLSSSPLAGRISSAQASTTPTSSISTINDNVPLADLPMIRLRLPRGGFGREYVAIQIKIQGKGPFDFMVDTGLTAEFITPHLQQVLGIQTGDRSSSRISGLAAGGGTSQQDLVELRGASLCCGTIAGDSELPFPPLHAVITDFPQEHIDPSHPNVEGMLGMEALSMFDVDFDFTAGRLRLWKPGTAAKSIASNTDTINKNMVEIPAVVINETGLIGIRISALEAKQPILGFLDCGSPFSTLNWAGASYLGSPPKGDKVYNKGPFISAVGIDGRPLELPTVNKQLSFAGDLQKDPDTGRPIGFEPPPGNWKPWDSVQLAVGDLPAFESVLGDGRTPYRGPAALIGLDVLAQRRVIFETGKPGTRQRRIWVSAD
mmetsp:Transcript_14510/g.34791  ORF Transcript_14510/g.34791 Transcript_14510/m.34791 type:complete len:436 (+) Transcript_14510:2-1309(+)